MEHVLEAPNDRIDSACREGVGGGRGGGVVALEEGVALLSGRG